MGTDTEFDVTIVAKDADTRAAILRIRDRLLAEHCGTEPVEVAAAVTEADSLHAAIEKVNGGESRRLAPIVDDGAGEPMSETLGALADPELADAVAARYPRLVAAAGTLVEPPSCGFPLRPAVGGMDPALSRGMTGKRLHH